MLKRAIFVTNSSSSTHLVYGIELSRAEIKTLLEDLYAKNKEAFDKEIKKYYGDDVPAEESVFEIITGMDEWTYWLSDQEILPKKVDIQDGEYSDSYWLDLNCRLDTGIKDGHVVLLDLTPTEFQELIALAESAGVTKPQRLIPRLDSWSTYD